MDAYQIRLDPISIEHIYQVVAQKRTLVLSTEAESAIRKTRQYLDVALEGREEPVYGVNTGFGSLCNVRISNHELEKLQRNLILSHACGVGPVLDVLIIRMMMFLKIQSLSQGYSGVSMETMQRLVDMYNANMLPVIYEQGSLGASGDLCPLAHMSLPLIGEGDVLYQGQQMAASKALDSLGWQPLSLRSKEGLALLNGTQFMSAHAVICTYKAIRLAELADAVAALSIDAWDCKSEPFDSRIHAIRKQRGQMETAAHIQRLLADSDLFHQPKKQVQDPYSFRCIPQVHGASRDAIRYCTEIITQEVNGVTDNPNIFTEDEAILSGGNFHGQPLALTLDFMAIAISEWASISERRVYRMLSGARGLPEFLVDGSGLNSGLMIPQYTAASLVSQNKQLCTPASVDSIASCNEQEDHVSMGANAATKCLRVAYNAEQVIAIELLTAAQAFEFRRPAQTSSAIEGLLTECRSKISFNTEDRFLQKDLAAALEMIQNIDIEQFR
jgi:histidine ammonia-lyase